ELTSLTRERLEDIGLPPSPSVASAELNLDLAEALISVHDKLSHKTREQAALQARYAQAVRRLGGSPTSAVEMRLDEAVIENVARLLEQRQGALAELRELRRQLEEASRLVEPTDGDDQLLDVAAGVYRGGR